MLMFSIQRCRLPLLLSGLIVLAAMTGCSNSTANKVAAMNDTNIKRVCHLYAAYQSRHGWAGPKDEEGFRRFVTQDMEEEKLAMMGVDPSKFDAVMTSERDGKPFKVKYGIRGGPGAKVAIVFEEEGKGGARQVAFTNGIVEDVEDSRYGELWGPASPVARPAPTVAQNSPSGGPPGIQNRPKGRPAGAPNGPTK